jgi:molybdate transport system substrate-binding protein
MMTNSNINQLSNFIVRKKEGAPVILTTVVLLVSAYFIMQGCGKTDRDTLKLFCGGGIRPPINEIIELFKEETGVEVKPTYAGSGVLLTQVQLTQDGDLYMPGDEMFMSRAEEKGYITEKKFAGYFIPVLMVQKGNPKGIASLADMGKADVRVGVGDPEACAVGEVTKSILERNGLEGQVRGNVVYTSATVVELANAVKLKTIDVAVVWDATAALYTDDTEVVPIPQEQNVIARIPIGILSFSKNKELARKFMDFVISDRGRSIFEKHGYTTKLH